MSDVASYELADINKGLAAVAEAGGNYKQASQECGIPRDTLMLWVKERYPDRYRDVKENYERALEDEIVAVARGNAVAAARGTTTAIQASLDALNDPRTPAREKSQIALNLSKVMGTNVDKVLALTGRPVDGDSGSATAVELIKGLVGSGVLRALPAAAADVDGTAEEVTE